MIELLDALDLELADLAQQLDDQAPDLAQQLDALGAEIIDALTGPDHALPLRQLADEIIDAAHRIRRSRLDVDLTDLADLAQQLDDQATAQQLDDQATAQQLDDQAKPLPSEQRQLLLRLR